MSSTVKDLMDHGERTLFIALDSNGHRIGTYASRDIAMAACQADSQEVGEDGIEGYDIIKHIVQK
jgi:hypothetical protein